MWANNVTGAVQPVAELAAICAERGVPLHTDAVQAAASLPVDFEASGAETMALSAHKMHGPKGVGALVARDPSRLRPLIWGGGQEGGLAQRHRERGRRRRLRGRAGGDARARRPPPRAARPPGGGAARAAQRCRRERRAAARPLAAAACPASAPTCWCCRSTGPGFAVSAGSACASGDSEPSHVLLAQGMTADRGAQRDPRLDRHRSTAEAEVDGFCGRPARVRGRGCEPARCSERANCRIPCAHVQRRRHRRMRSTWRSAGSAGDGAVHGEAGDTGCGDAVRIELAAERRPGGASPATARSPVRTRRRRRRWPAGWPRDATCSTPPARRRRLGERAAAGRRTIANASRWRPMRCTRRSRARWPRDRCRLRAGRVAVAMSGGVDSAVALLKAARGRPASRWASRCGSGSTRWRPTRSGPAARRSRCAPPAAPATRPACRTSRSTCASAFGSRWWTTSCAATPPGQTPNPVRALQRQLPVRRAGRRSPTASAPPRLATGHYARIVERDGRGAGRAWRRPRQGPVLHAGARARARSCAASGSRWATSESGDARAGARRRTGRGRPAREPGGLLRRRRRPPRVPRAPRRRRPRRARS